MKWINIYVPAAPSHKKKNKKKAKPAAVPTTSSTSLSVDSGFLCCAHHEVMVAGLTMLGVGTPQNKGQCTHVLYSPVDVVEEDGRRKYWLNSHSVPASCITYPIVTFSSPLSLLRCPSVSAPGGARRRRPASVSAGLCAQCYCWGCRTGPCCDGSGEGMVRVPTRWSFDCHSWWRPWTHLCPGERRLVKEESKKGKLKVRLRQWIY